MTQDQHTFTVEAFSIARNTICTFKLVATTCLSVLALLLLPRQLQDLRVPSKVAVICCANSASIPNTIILFSFVFQLEAASSFHSCVMVEKCSTLALLLCISSAVSNV